MSELNKLIDHHKHSIGTLPQRALAELEKAIWGLYVSDQKENPSVEDRRIWIRAYLEIPPADFEMRSTMLRAGIWVNPLWKMVDEGAPLRVAVRLLREAKDAVANNGVSHDEAVKTAIHNYNSSGYVAHTGAGKVYRKNTPTHPPKKEEFSADDTQNARTKQFVAQVRELANEYVAKSLHEYADIEQIEIQKPSDDFVAFVTEACEDLRRRVISLRAEGRKSARVPKVDRTMLRKAGEVLGISTVFGKKVDLVAAKRIMLRRAGALHPDKRGGSHETRSEYQAVVEAYKVLEDYMGELRPHANGERNHEGR